MLLFVDLETSDLLKRDLPLDDPSQPWAVTIAAELTDLNGKTRDFFYTRIRADGRRVRDGAAAVHGISSAQAGRDGVNEIAALAMLCGFAAQANYVVGHAIDFDRKVVESLLLRLRKDPKVWVRPGLEFICTMKTATSVCKIEPKVARDDGSYKWPSLDEACEIILNEPRREGAHDAWDDVQRAKRLFLALRSHNLIEV